MENIIRAKDRWTKRGKYYFRIWDNKLWRKEMSPDFYAGYEINYAPLDSERTFKVANEWLNTSNN